MAQLFKLGYKLGYNTFNCWAKTNAETDDFLLQNTWAVFFAFVCLFFLDKNRPCQQHSNSAPLTNSLKQDHKSDNRIE